MFAGCVAQVFPVAWGEAGEQGQKISIWSLKHKVDGDAFSEMVTPDLFWCLSGWEE